MAPMFSLDTYSLDRFSQFPSYLKVVLQLCDNWRLFAPRVEEKASHLAALGQIHDHARTSTAPFLPFMRSA